MQELIASLGLDPAMVSDLLFRWIARIVAALAIFIIGRWISAAIASLVVKAARKANIDETLTKFLRSLVYMSLLVMVVLTAIGFLGVPTANFLAIVGAAGLAIGLALQGSLSNFASGVMLVFFRPFKVGDFIDAGGVSGTVESIGIFSTTIKTPDNCILIVPNGQIYSGTIKNFSARDTRRIDLVFGIGYDDDVVRAKEIMQTVIERDERILGDPAPTIMMLELADSSVNFAVRPWVASGDYWTVRADLLEGIKKELEGNGLSIPYPQRDVHLIGEVASGG